MPIKKLESDKAIFATVVCRSSAIAGKPGKYISIENGPRAVNIPNINISFVFLLLFITTIVNTIWDIMVNGYFVGGKTGSYWLLAISR